MSTKVIAAIDQGSSSTRCLLFDMDGHVVDQAKRSHTPKYPHPGWVEEDPLEILDHARETLREVSRKSGYDIIALGITNQRETTVIWDRKTGEPIYPAISWQDSRTEGMCRELIRQGVGPLVAQKTGLPIFPYFSATKIAWILQNVQGARSRAERGELAFGTIDAWLVWWLTGGPDGGRHATDASNASRTMLFNLETMAWDDELCRLFDIPPSILPEVMPSSAEYGAIRSSSPDARPIPLLGVIGDQQAALVGQGCIEPGDVKNTYGTACALLMNTGRRLVFSSEGLITTIAYALPGEPPAYALEGPTGTTGAAIDWLVNSLKLSPSFNEVQALVSSVADSGGVYFVPAFSGLYAPYWDLAARGTITGITRHTTPAHLLRAALDAIALQSADVIRRMIQESGHDVSELRADGGASANAALMQIQADVLGRPVKVSASPESTALGAAYLAGLQAGVWKDVRAFKENWRSQAVYRPAIDNDARDMLWKGWNEAVAKTRYRLD